VFNLGTRSANTPKSAILRPLPKPQNPFQERAVVVAPETEQMQNKGTQVQDQECRNKKERVGKKGKMKMNSMKKSTWMKRKGKL
jgi:hypothetical protein